MIPQGAGWKHRRSHADEGVPESGLGDTATGFMRCAKIPV